MSVCTYVCGVWHRPAIAERDTGVRRGVELSDGILPVEPEGYKVGSRVEPNLINQLIN